MDSFKNEILFRGKDVDTNEWREGCVIKVNDDEYGNTTAIIPINSECYRFNMSGWHIIPDTLCQFTGFVDKNEKKIFSHDIVKTKFGRLCIVKWFSSPKYGGWDLKVINTLANIRLQAPPPTDMFNKNNLEVVGNIYDNAEMLYL